MCYQLELQYNKENVEKRKGEEIKVANRNFRTEKMDETETETETETEIERKTQIVAPADDCNPGKHSETFKCT